MWFDAPGVRARTGVYTLLPALLAVSIIQLPLPALARERLVLSLDGAAAPPCLAFSPDGRLLAAPDGGVTKVWDVPAGTLRHTLRVTSHCLAFSRDGKLLATDDAAVGTIRLWDMASGRLRRTFQAERPEQYSGFTALAFSPTAKRLVAGEEDGGRVSHWDVESGKVTGRYRLHGASGVVSLAFASGTVVVSSGGATVVIWDARNGFVRSEHVVGLDKPFAVSPDRKHVIVKDLDNRSTSLIATARSGWTPGGMPLAFPPGTRPRTPRAACFSPGGDLLAWACSDGKVRVWRTQLAQPAERRPYIETAAIWKREDSDRMKRLAAWRAQLEKAGGGDPRLADVAGMTSLTLWRRAFRNRDLLHYVPREPHETFANPGPTSLLVFSPDGESLASADEDGTIRLFDAATVKGKRYRTWSTSAGFRFEAVLIREERDSLYLKKKDGKVVRMRVSRMSRADREFLDDRLFDGL